MQSHCFQIVLRHFDKHRNMAVRLFEGKEHAASYLQYRVAPRELISRIMSYMEKRVSVYVEVFQQTATCWSVLLLFYVTYSH